MDVESLSHSVAHCNGWTGPRVTATVRKRSVSLGFRLRRDFGRFERTQVNGCEEPTDNKQPRAEELPWFECLSVSLTLRVASFVKQEKKGPNPKGPRAFVERPSTLACRNTQGLMSLGVLRNLLLGGGQGYDLDSARSCHPNLGEVALISVFFEDQLRTVCRFL
jgi:hypothetical protein